ncbi:MAG: class I SAM-dependent methyltransferase [Burkholderiaceae bacterium]
MTVIFSKSIFSIPAFKALAIQCISLVLTLIFIAAVAVLAQYDVNLLCAMLLQGVLAMSIARWRGMPSWWLIIQFFFPVAIVATLSLHLPPVVFLGAFVFLLALYWTTFQTQVPFYPSGPETWGAVANLLPQNQAIKFIDIGSGLGGLILNLDKRRSDCDFTGIELAPLPWLISWLRAFFGRRHCHFLRGDYNQLNFSHYDVVFAYLSPAVMTAVWEKAQAEMRPGTLLISYEFRIATKNPDNIIRPSAQGAELYCWRMK